MLKKFLFKRRCRKLIKNYFCYYSKYFSIKNKEGKISTGKILPTSSNVLVGAFEVENFFYDRSFKIHYGQLVCRIVRLFDKAREGGGSVDERLHSLDHLARHVFTQVRNFFHNSPKQDLFLKQVLCGLINEIVSLLS